MVDLDIKISTTLGQTTLDAAAVGWLLVDFITGLDEQIKLSTRNGRIQFRTKRPFCELQPASDTLICHVHHHGHSRTAHLHTLTDLNPDLQHAIHAAYQNGR